MAISRRSFTFLSGGFLGSFLGSCAAAESSGGVRLRARPAKPGAFKEAGTHSLQIRGERDSLLYIPKELDPEKPAPLLVYLHGATGNEQQGIRRISAFADEYGFLLLSPASIGSSWDAIRDGYGADVTAIDQALTRTFAARLVDPKRIALCGFSDGASYALGLGLSNGELFHSVMAFSPGFIPSGSKQNGKPRIFISHGTEDNVLPIDNCSRRIVPQLKDAGYKVTYREFTGPHTVPRETLVEAIRFFIG